MVQCSAPDVGLSVEMRPLNVVSWPMSTLDEQLAAIHMEGHDEEAKTWTEPFADTAKADTFKRFRSPVRISIDREALAALDRRAIAAQMSVGVVAGWLVGGSGLLCYVLTGLAGSLVGGILLERLGLDLVIRNPTTNRIATATLGAVVVVLLARLLG